MNYQINYNWKISHNLAQIFFLVNKTKLLEIYNKITQGRDLTPKLWIEFVDSHDLWSFGMKLIRGLSSITIEDLAFSECHEEGSVANAGLEDYILIPLSYGQYNPDVKQEDSNSNLGLACQQNLKRIMIFLFADIHKKRFLVRFVTHPTKEYDENSIRERLLPGGERKHTIPESESYLRYIGDLE